MLTMLWKRNLQIFSLNTLFCLLIGVLVIRQGLAPNYTQAVVVSLSIGWSIQLTFVVFDRIFPQQTTGYVLGLVQSIIGLLLGMCLGGALISGDMSVLFFDPFASEVLLFSLFFAVVGGSFFVTQVRLNEQNQQLLEFEANQLRQEAKLLETKIQLLQSQIEPHFLFNTLSNITSLIAVDPLLAEKSLINFTELLRVKFDRSKGKSSSLADELWLIKIYLELHGMRLGERLSYQIVTDQFEIHHDLEQVTVPSLLIQPLVENAIKHGIEPSISGGSICISLDAEDDNIVVKVVDTGVGIDPNRQPETSSGAGVGIANIRQRLASIYGGRGGLDIRENSDSGVTAILTIPREEQP